MSRRAAPWVLGVLAAVVLAAALLSVSLGAIPIPPDRVLAVLIGEGSDPARARDGLVILSIRLPRTLLGLLVGAGLAVSGALMQGLFRNPLADPALVGVSSGAGLAAAVIIVLGDRILAGLGLAGPLPYAALPAGAFLGGLCATLILYALATRSGRTAVATMLLAGIALGALNGALTGLLTFVS
uniref:iron chelate uptake ABC transporter family permease subunit n=1 Tax=Methylobacterium sp. B34 TaxID=95563 RepID=UPI0005B299A0